MADMESLNITFGATTDDKQNEQVGKQIIKGVEKGIGNNGYIKLGAEITNYKYPKQKINEKTGITTGVNYSNLQKAQDELLSNWKKLSKKGFSSDDEKIFNMLKSYRTYQQAVSSQYSGREDQEFSDEQVSKIRRSIGNQINRYFTRLLDRVSIGSGKTGYFMNTDSEQQFEVYARQAIKKYRAAESIGIDLSNDKSLTREDISKINNAVKDLEAKARAEQTLAKRQYEHENADKIAKDNAKKLAQIEETRMQEAKTAVAIPQYQVDDVELTATKVENLGVPTDYKQTQEDKYLNKTFVKGLDTNAKSRGQSSPKGERDDTPYDRGSDTIPLGYREQIWNPIYLFEDFLSRMEHGGTYVDTNSLLRQTMQALPEEIKKSVEKMVTTIDKDEAARVFNTFDKTSQSEFSKLASELNITRQLLVNVAKVQGGLMAGREDTTPEDLKNAIWVSLADMMEKGTSQIDFENFKTAIQKITNMLANRYSNQKDSIASTIRRRKKVGDQYVDDEEIGVGRNYEEVAKTLKEVFEDFDKTANILQKKAIEAFPEFYGGNTNTAKSTKSSNSEKESTFDRVFASKLATSFDVIKSHLGDAAQGIASLLTITKVDDTASLVSESKQTKILNEDSDTGFNSNEDANKVISNQGNVIDTANTVQSILENLYQAFGSCPCEAILQAILTELQNISQNGVNVKGGKSTVQETQRKEMQAIMTTTANSLRPLQAGMLDVVRNLNGTPKSKEDVFTNYYEGKDIAEQHKAQRRREREAKAETELNGNISRSIIETSLKDPAKVFTRIADTLGDLFNIKPEYKKVLAATSEEQDRLAAEQVERYGSANGRNYLGDKALFARRVSMWRGDDKKFEDFFKDLKLSDGIKIDTTEVTSKLANILSGKSMRNAQMGGSPLRNLIGYGTGFIGMPSLEKSRAAAEALNQINANIREAMNKTLTDIQDKESALAGMIESGDLKLDAEGNVLEGSSTEAKTLVVQLENVKVILASLLADMGNVNTAIKQSHGDIGKVMKRLSFTSPVLRENNAIVNNINAGYDKGGKALKFQTRTAEILNYTFQLMGRHIGQTLKQWALMLNPINLIKRAFGTFTSYSTKWQRTINVIKYNIRAIIEPFMSRLAQFLVNGIGFIDIISMKIQKAFGNMPVSLFDQAAADAEKIREELEAGANVTAGFDELHDIGSDNSGANDLLGEIYKPQLSKEWEDLANKIGDLFAGIIKGDLGFGEVMLEILKILGETLGTIAKTIWNWFKETAIGKYITEHWKDILLKILGLFLSWKLLKIAGKHLANALFSAFNGGEGASLFGKLGKTLSTGFSKLFSSGGLIGMFKAGGASLGTVFATSLVAVLGVALAGIAIGVGSDKMRKNTAYNAGVDSVGGDSKDKKSNVGAAIGTTLGTTAGGALAGLAIGGPIGAAIGAGIGAIAGLLTTVLAPAFEKTEIAARNANNEMQKVEYYEGQVQGASTQVEKFTELEKLMSEAIQGQVDKLYKQGDELGVNRTRMDELIQSVKNGTFSTDMLSASEQGLSGNLLQLSDLQYKNSEATKKLTEAKQKLIKAETDLAIAQDIEAGNFELAAARVEVAYANEVYGIDEATKKMTQIIKKGSAEQRSEILKDMSPDIKKNWDKYYSTTQTGLNEMYKLYDSMKEEERKAWLQNINPELERKLTERNQLIKQKVDEANGFLRFLDINKNGKILGISYIGDVPGYATGTNYVPNDGLAYLHQGEAVIPKKYNQPFTTDNSNLENAVYDLARQVEQIGAKVEDGIAVKGQFVQRGSDLVATVEKANNKLSNNILNNKVYAR